MADGMEVSPWEDINPTMGSVQRHEQRSRSLGPLEPASAEQFRDELTACLALVVPVGMTEESRREWLMVAWETLKHLPADILSTGCRAARETCDHPSKIVPTILRETEQTMRWRQESERDRVTLALPGPVRPLPVMDRRGQPMSEEDTAELNGILEKLGATARYRADGSRYLIDSAAE